MKNTMRKYLALVLVFIIVTSVCFLFSTRKEGMFIDEIYTYGLSNNVGGPFLRDMKGGNIVDTVFSRDELIDYVAVTGDEGFDFASVYYNQVNDVHPPLYYWLFNIASSLNHGTFSKWTGLALDYVIYMLSLIVLYNLVRKLRGSRENAAAAAVLYGLSLMGLSTMLMIRMYVLLTLLTLCLVYLIACMMEDLKPLQAVLAGLCLLAGMMTQYYFVFYAFFLCGCYVFYCLFKRDWRALKWFVPCALIGTLSLLVFFPAALDHLFSGKLVSGDSAVENLKNLAQYPVRLKTFVFGTHHGMKGPIYIGVAAVIAVLALCAKKRVCFRDGQLIKWLVIIVPAFVTFVLVAIISPVDELRYIYNIAPIFVLAVSLLLYIIEKSLDEKQLSYIKKNAVLACIALFALWQARCAPPEYLYPEYAEYNAALAEHTDAPCVYLSENHFEPITQDLLQLLTFDEFYVTEDDHLDKALDYIGETQEAVVYIDISVFWSSGYDAETLIEKIAEISNFDTAEVLYQNGLSTTYVISR